MSKTEFNYNNIPLGFYDNITKSKNGMRSFWHNQKFQRIIDGLPEKLDSILDFGCFSGTFLSMIPYEKCQDQVGVDILEKQVEYASLKYGENFREFIFLNADLETIKFDSCRFDYVTLIEVIEHLKPEEIKEILQKIHDTLKPDGKLIISTPNYFSLWPVLEFFLNKISDVKYEEQHITKFTAFNFHRKILKIFSSFDDKYKIEYITTSHFISPYIALFSYKFAEFSSKLFKLKNWKFLFGSLIIIKLSKNQ